MTILTIYQSKLDYSKKFPSGNFYQKKWYFNERIQTGNFDFKKKSVLVETKLKIAFWYDLKINTLLLLVHVLLRWDMKKENNIRATLMGDKIFISISRNTQWIANSLLFMPTLNLLWAIQKCFWRID